MKNESILKKVVLLGDSAVGKTSLIRRFVLDQFETDYMSTIGTKVLKKTLPIKFLDVDYMVNLMVWDIIGSQGFESSQSRHIAGVNGAILVMDLTKKDTLKSIEEYWIPLLSEVTGDIIPPLLFIGNKIDLIDDKNSISDIEEQLLNFGSKYQMKGSEDHKPWLLTSAKTGENVESGF
ncbi:unnamed protein product [marine sediment metagenome]|uniref:GTP-binding protein n=1 Tax=marine sediment metagenome TaxID=412755 RepID=X0TK34_9ZZZZ